MPARKVAEVQLEHNQQARFSTQYSLGKKIGLKYTSLKLGLPNDVAAQADEVSECLLGSTSQWACQADTELVQALRLQRKAKRRQSSFLANELYQPTYENGPATFKKSCQLKRLETLV